MVIEREAAEAVGSLVEIRKQAQIAAEEIHVNRRAEAAIRDREEGTKIADGIQEGESHGNIDSRDQRLKSEDELKKEDKAPCSESSNGLTQQESLQTKENSKVIK